MENVKMKNHNNKYRRERKKKKEGQRAAEEGKTVRGHGYEKATTTTTRDGWIV